MNKSEFVKMVAEKSDYSQKDVKSVIDAYEEVILEAMASGEEVRTGVVTFVVKDTKPRTARNLHTGETINVPAGKKVSIKPSKSLKDSVK
jgi:DNA-binding protein HU-beta